MERREVQALVARMPLAVAHVHDVIEARVIAREALKELAHRKCLDLAGVALAGLAAVRLD
jgi:hypothetical protein